VEGGKKARLLFKVEKDRDRGKTYSPGGPQKGFGRANENSDDVRKGGRKGTTFLKLTRRGGALAIGEGTR